MTPSRRPSSAAAFAALALLSLIGGCASQAVRYGRETLVYAPRYGPRTIAVAPTINLSGQSGPDALLQSDIVYKELQQVRGVTVIPVNRVIEAYAGLGLNRVESVDQAFAVCDALGCDALLLPTITAFDPYDPPKFGGSVQIFVRKSVSRDGHRLDPRQLARQASGGKPSLEQGAQNADFIQVAEMFDAAAGSTRERVEQYAKGRTDPTGAMGMREYYLSMDRYAGFAWHALIEDALARFAD